MLIVSWTLLVGSTDHKVSFKWMNGNQKVWDRHRGGHGSSCASILALTGIIIVAT